jgi:hypothetical protein
MARLLAGLGFLVIPQALSSKNDIDLTSAAPHKR